MDPGRKSRRGEALIWSEKPDRGVMEVNQIKESITRLKDVHFREGHWVFGGIERELDVCESWKGRSSRRFF